MTTLSVQLRTMRAEAKDVVSLELLPLAGQALPPFEAGSHVDLHLPNGLVRSYSLLNDPAEKGRYCLGILLDRASRGGSRAVHEVLRVGSQLQISAPRNNFALDEQARHSVLIAGGIGITPMLSMAHRLMTLDASFELHYLARSRESAAFLDVLKAFGDRVSLRFDDEQGGPPDLAALLGKHAPDAATHFYACGPAVMLDAFEQQCQRLGHGNIHVERFAAVAVAAAADARKEFVVELKKSGKRISVASGQELLQVLIDAGAPVEFSCREGVCGSCETRVLAGEPDHRDSVLSPKERAANNAMMVCVSGCKSDLLVLDL